jgi:hypothetical protein
VTIEASIDPDRCDLVVRDVHGLTHGAVLCDRNSESPYIVAMCDFFDAVDNAREARDPNSFALPEQRWTVADEYRGVMTCLRCIGS